MIVIRHGHTEWNAQGRYMGHLDAPLTARGLQQAERLAQRLARLELHAIYSSDLGRAQRTAQIIADTCGLTVCVDPMLRERHMGVFQGLTREEMSHRFPDELRAYDEDVNGYVIPTGESGVQRGERSLRALRQIAERHQNQNVLVATHGGVLLGLFELALSLGPNNGARFRRDNASFNAFGYDNGTWILETWNDLSHLDTRTSVP
jgi:broad specificity phosphatase PhoE